MKHTHKKFLEFNGKSIYFLSVDGTYWIALKPICDALGVNWNRQFQNLKEDEIFDQLFAEQQMVGADGKLRQMVSLPEKWVYGWLLSIRSESADLKEYKLTCYELLFNHFHGAITKRLAVAERKEAIEKKNERAREIESLEAQLRESDIYQQLEKARQGYQQSESQIKSLNKQVVQQLDIWASEE